jgi:hypothetical protein
MCNIIVIVFYEILEGRSLQYLGIPYLVYSLTVLVINILVVGSMVDIRISHECCTNYLYYLKYSNQSHQLKWVHVH